MLNPPIMIAIENRSEKPTKVNITAKKSVEIPMISASVPTVHARSSSNPVARHLLIHDDVLQLVLIFLTHSSSRDKSLFQNLFLI